MHCHIKVPPPTTETDALLIDSMCVNSAKSMMPTAILSVFL